MSDSKKLSHAKAQAEVEKLHQIQDEVTVAHGNNKQKLLRRALYKTSDSEMSQDLV